MSKHRHEETVSAKPESVEDAVAMLPDADLQTEDDFSGAKNSKVANPAPGISYMLPTPDRLQWYLDHKFVTGKDLPGKNPTTGELEPARTVGPMPGHVLVGCRVSVREALRASNRKKIQQFSSAVKDGGQTPPDRNEGVESSTDIKVNRAQVTER